MSETIIRWATPDDCDAIHDLIIELAIYEKMPDEVKSTPADLRAALFSNEKSRTGSPALSALVAELDGEVVGFAVWFLNYSTWLGKHGIYLEDLYVKQSIRGAGIGTALMQRIAEICTERGYGRFEWWVLDWNAPAIDFYRSRGAVAMDEWTVFRLTGDALHAMAVQPKAE